MLKTASLVAILLGLAAATPAAAAVPEGSFMFNNRCGTCHQDAGVLMPRLMKLPNDQERRAYLEKFLARHHARDAQERALIVDYLLRYQPR